VVVVHPFLVTAITVVAVAVAASVAGVGRCGHQHRDRAQRDRDEASSRVHRVRPSSESWRVPDSEEDQQISGAIAVTGGSGDRADADRSVAAALASAELVVGLRMRHSCATPRAAIAAPVVTSSHVHTIPM
jgi:hypothetical protein